MFRSANLEWDLFVVPALPHQAGAGNDRAGRAVLDQHKIFRADERMSAAHQLADPGTIPGERCLIFLIAEGVGIEFSEPVAVVHGRPA